MTQTNWGILGHEWAVRLLQGHVAQGRARHAYLITGPAGVGRRTLALRFAQALNCTRPPAPGAFCGDCRDCRDLARMAHPDLALVAAADHGGTIKVDQVRELQRGLSLASYQARYRVALLLGFEGANPNAANALLKTLEEPPDHVVLLLTAESAEGLLATIVSRCEVLRLRPIPAEIIREDLTDRLGLPSDQAHLIAQIAGGRPGYARQLAENPEAMARRSQRLDDQATLLGADLVARFDYARRLSGDVGTLQATLDVWVSFWQDVLHQAGGADLPLANPDRAQEIEALASQLDLAETHRIVLALEATQSRVERNVNRRLAAEVLMLDLPRLPVDRPAG